MKCRQLARDEEGGFVINCPFFVRTETAFAIYRDPKGNLYLQVQTTRELLEQNVRIWFLKR